MQKIKAFWIFIVFAFSAQISAAQDLILRAQIIDEDGTITALEVFENADALGNLVLGYRHGANAFLDAGTVQSTLMRAGALWNNPNGLRRIQVVAGSHAQAVQGTAQMKTPAGANEAAKTQEVLVFNRSMSAGEVVRAEDIEFRTVQAHQVSQGATNPQSLIGKVVRWPVREGMAAKSSDLMSPIVIKRNESVAVTWSSNGVSLGMTGIAQKDGAVGDIIIVLNPASKKPIEVLITAPGQGAAGPLAQSLRQNKS